MRLSGSVLYVFFSGVIIFTSCRSDNQEAGTVGPRRQGPLTVDGFIVRPQSVSENVEVPGSLMASEETQIRAEVSGRVTRLNIQEGGVIDKGTLLVKLFDGDLQAQLKKLQVQLQIAEKTEERQAELLKINGISQQDYDLASLDVDNLKADIEATRIAISKTEVRAPYRGKLGLRNISLGSYISPSEIITSIREVGQLNLEFSIPEKYAKGISKGHKVKFKVDGGDEFHQATVLATENSVEQTTRTLRVKAVVNETHELVPGVFARVNLQLSVNENALMVPTQAVIPQARNKQIIVLRHDSAQYTVVETGIRDSAFIEIVSGLKAGDTVITTGLMAIKPNGKLKISNIKQYE